jgi:coproporphyrinogen III oxidase
MEISKEHITTWLKQLQTQICAALEKEDGKAKFSTQIWDRAEGGGGISRVMQNGGVIEKGGVMFSAVHGEAPDFLFKEAEHSNAAGEKLKPTFYAAGVSIVIHPKSPMVPIIHMNVRYFEMGNRTKWLGGGIDLTPHYVNNADAKFFHTELKKVCDRWNPDYYPEFKKWADDYFFIKHRNETRGIGGIFFDRLFEREGMSFEKNLNFWQDVGSIFPSIYTELMKRNKYTNYTDHQKQWQLLRRGRYVEFNLVYDKGTKFGLESNGRIESILMSLPKLASWEYDHKVAEGSEEERTLSLLKKGINWV